MGLVGNLEDLALGDILQIVSLSKKSGVLTLESSGQKGTITFLEGQVVRATSSQFREHLGDILKKYRLAGAEDLDRALKIQAELDHHQPLGRILAEQFGISREKIEAAITAKIEKIIYSFFAWTDGVFAFHLDEPEEYGSARLNPLDFMLEQGLNPQWLALEGRRLASEGRILPDWPGEDPSTEDFADTPSSFPSAGLASGSRRKDSGDDTETGRTLLLIVDDDEPTCAALCTAFNHADFDVRTYPHIAELLDACDQWIGQGKAPTLLVDLIMPRLDGHGILGGLEVIQLVRQKYPQLQLLLMTDHPSADAEQSAREQGVLEVLQKPRKEEVGNPVGKELLRELVLKVSSLLHVPPDKVPPTINDEPLLAPSEPSVASAASLGSPGLHLLKGMLQELASPLLGGDIILLVLRFASELMNRAVIFDVRDHTLVGLGQFGLDSVTDQPDHMVRKMRLQVSTDSVLATVLDRKVAVKTRLGEGATDRLLKEQLGGGDANEIFLGPLVSEGKVVAMLYGDNFPQQQPITDMDALEVFLSQAGMAMEKLLLERRLDGQVVQ